MPANHFDVIVIGVGSMGASACWHLTRRGVRVLGLDQFEIPHAHGSHHGMSRMVRLAYFEHPDYVTLLHRAYENWRKIEQDSGESLLHLTGGLYIGYEDGDLVSGSLLAAQQHDLRHEMLSCEDIQSRFPQFNPADGMVGFLEKDAGYVRSSSAVAAFAQRAMIHGAQIHGCEPVRRIDHENAATVTVQTDKATYSANRVIIAGGAWSSQLLGNIGVNLTVTRQTLGWFWPQNHSQFTYPKMMCWAVDPNRAGQYSGVYYGFPFVSQEPGFKLARHWPGDETTPDNINRNIHPNDERKFREFLSQYIPQANGPVISIKTCLYTNSADHHFIIDRHPMAHHNNVFIACGFSGHGFKFASVVGEILADLGESGQTDLPIDFLSLSRFKR